MTTQYDIETPLWETPGVGFVVLRYGYILKASPNAVAMLTGGSMSTSDGVLGRHMHSIVPDHLGIDLDEAIARLYLPDAPPTAVRMVVAGRALLAWVAINDETDDSTLILRYATAHDTDSLIDSGQEVIFLDHIHLGPLDVLTPCEIRVGVLLARGMTIKEVAKAIHRAPKTVERHRESIGIKLNVRNKVEMALKFERAGLVLGDADRKRVRTPKAEPQAAA